MKYFIIFFTKIIIIILCILGFIVALFESFSIDEYLHNDYQFVEGNPPSYYYINNNSSSDSNFPTDIIEFNDKEHIYVYKDLDGRILFKTKYEPDSEFKEGLIIIKDYHIFMGSTYGYMDRNGNIIASPHFQSAIPFENGIGIVIKDGKRGYIIKKYIKKE